MNECRGNIEISGGVINVADLDFDALETKEKNLAKVLLKNNLMTEEVFGKYLKFKEECDDMGKQSLWKVLLRLEYLTQGDLDEYIEERKEPYIQFCKTLVNDGFMEQEQWEAVQEQCKNGKEIVMALSDENVMTRDNFLRSFIRHTGEPRLSEWLVSKAKLTAEQLKNAKKLQRECRLSDFLIQHGFCKENVVRKVEEKIAAVS